MRELSDQQELLPGWRYHALMTNRLEEIGVAEAEHRNHAVIELTIRDLKAGALAHFPSGNFSANSAWTQLAAISHNLARFGQVIGSPGADDPSPAGSPALAECLHRGPDQDQGLADSGLARHLEFDELHLPSG